MESTLGNVILPIGGAVVGAVAGILSGLALRDVKPVVVALLIFLGLPGLVALPLLLASDPPWRFLGPALVLAGSAGFFWGALRLQKKWRLPWTRVILLGPALLSTVAAMVAYGAGIAVCWALGYFRDPDWGFVLTVYAIPTAALALLLGTASALATAWFSLKVSRGRPRQEVP